MNAAWALFTVAAVLITVGIYGWNRASRNPYDDSSDQLWYGMLSAVFLVGGALLFAAGCIVA